MSSADHYIGVGNTLLRLADGLLKLRVLPPDDDPTPREALDDLLESVEGFVDEADLGLLGVRVLRLCAALKIRPTPMDVPEGVVVADVLEGLDFLQRLDSEDQAVATGFRSTCVAISCLTDYAYLLTEEFHGNVSDQEKHELLRSALLVGENSVRGMPSEARGEAGATLLAQFAELLAPTVEDEDNGPPLDG